MGESVRTAIVETARRDGLPCAEAHGIAERLGVSPGEVGRAASATSVRLSRCQLGLFGYGAKSEGRSKIVLPATNLPDEIVSTLRASSVDGRIACVDAWAIARAYDYPRLGIANIIEALGLKVSPCQLGCF